MADDFTVSAELEIELSSSRIAVQPGGAPAEISLAVHNTSRIVEQYTISLVGLDPAWFTHSTQTVSLFPGDSDHLVLTFHIPPQPAVTAGTYPFSVIAQSRSGALQRRAEGAVTIAGQAAFQMDLAPRRQMVRGRGRYRVLVTNIGTADGQLSLDATDTEEALTFKFPGEQQPNVAARSTIEVPLEATPKRRPWVGAHRSYDFVVTARRPANREEVGNVNGQLVYLPRFASLSLLRRLLLVGGLLVAALSAFLMLSRDRNLTDTVLAIAPILRSGASATAPLPAGPTVPVVVGAGGGASGGAGAAGGGGGGAPTAVAADQQAAAAGDAQAIGGGGGPAGGGITADGVPTPVPPAATAASVFMAGVDATQSAAATAIATPAPAATSTPTPPSAAGKPTPAAPAVTNPSAVVSPVAAAAQVPAGVCSPPQRPSNAPAPAPAAAKPSAVASPAAARRPINDLAQADPTTWWYCAGVTADQLTQALKANQARLLDVQVEIAKPTLLLSAVMVANQGPYARDWWWYFGLDDIQVQERFTTNNARPIALKAYDAAGQTRYVVVMVSNKAPDQKNFWWFPDLADPRQVDHLLMVNKARLTDVDPFSQQGERRFAAVMIANTAADQVTSMWADGVTPDQINADVARINGRAVEIEPGDARGTTFDVILESCPCPKNWWAIGLDDAGLASTITQTGGRITSLATYLVNNQRRFAVTLIDNT